MDKILIDIMEGVLESTKLRKELGDAYHDSDCRVRGKFIIIGGTVIIHEVGDYYVTVKHQNIRIIHTASHEQYDSRYDNIITDWQNIVKSEESFFQYSLVHDLSLFTFESLSEVSRLYDAIVEVIF